MSTTGHTTSLRLRYHPGAYQFVFAALRYAQEHLGRSTSSRSDEDEHHITGAELLDGIRRLGIEQFGLMATTVFRCWGVRNTADFGRIVFELIDRGEMRKTDRDQLEDFFDIYDFEEVFVRQYQVDTVGAFRR